ncbi:MAG: VOC family protein [Flavisolibacter sp.]
MDMETLPNIQLAVPFFMVTNMDASLQFYSDKLGFTVTNKWAPCGKIEWCLLKRDGVSLMLQELRNKEEIGGKKGEGVSIYFQCKDALALYHELMKHQIKMKEPFVGNNMWVVSVVDPDGYHLYFESPTEVREETMYSDWVKTNKIN